MKEALSRALAQLSAEDTTVDRILAASFFRSRPMQSGTTAPIIHLEDRRLTGASERARSRP